LPQRRRDVVHRHQNQRADGYQRGESGGRQPAHAVRGRQGAGISHGRSRSDRIARPGRSACRTARVPVSAQPRGWRSPARVSCRAR